MIHLRRLRAMNFKQLADVELRLPERGRVLVQGRNESGKSTLFEAIFFGLFGRSLSAEGGAKLEDLIHYGRDRGQVDVDIGLPKGRLLRIRRALRSGRPNVWELDIVGAEGEVEERIRANREVNARVEAELGFDAEAMLNTCFVEQKKLDKLEGMNRLEREQSLMKLLNLDHLLAVTDALKVRPADRQALERLRDKVHLARAQAERPRVEAELAGLEKRLLRLEAREAFEAALRRSGDLRALGEELAAAVAAEAELAGKAAEVEALDGALRALDQVDAARGAADQAHRSAARAMAAAADARAARDEAAPAVLARGRAVRRLQNRIGWLDDVRREASVLDEAVRRRDEELASLAGDLEALNQARRALVEARAAGRESHDAIAGLEQDRRAFEVRAALTEWLTAADDGGDVETGPELEVTRRLRDGAVRRQRYLGVGMLFAGAALGAGTLGPRLGLPGGLSTALQLAGAVGLVGLAWLLVLTIGRAQQLVMELGRQEGLAAARARDAEQRRARLEAAAARLAALQAVRPANTDRGRQALAEIDARLADRDRAAIEAELAAAQGRAARAKVDAEALEAREAELRARCQGRDGEALGHERDAWERLASRHRAASERRAPAIQALAAGLDLPGGDGARSAIEGELGELRARMAELKRAVDALPALEAEAAQEEARAKAQAAAAHAGWARARELAGPVLADLGHDLADPATLEGALAAVRAAHAAAGGSAAREALARAARRAAELRGRRESGRQDLEARLRQARALAARAGEEDAATAAASPAADGDDEALASWEASLRAAAERFSPAGADAAPEDRAALSAAVEAAKGRLGVLRHEQARLEAMLGLSGVKLDEARSQEEAETLDRELRRRDLAAQMVDLAGKRVVQGVLPGTLVYMQRILPGLTDQRYLEARLADDYKIEVYDERAGNWKRKNIFSGGAKDQFSLALRLAFALATLPEERGAAPSFLFLDEPLGAFDVHRAEALIELLSTGELARAFNQIFLISHIAVDAERFDYRILMEGGRVVESDLPGGIVEGEPSAVQASLELP